MALPFVSWGGWHRGWGHSHWNSHVEVAHESHGGWGHGFSGHAGFGGHGGGGTKPARYGAWPCFFEPEER
jgi:hypothetical protein